MVLNFISKISLKTYLLSALTFFIPIVPLVLAVLFLTILDTVTGIMAARKNKIEITSAKLYRIVPKLTGYILFITAFFVAQQVLITEIEIVKFACYVVTIVELKSLSENIFKFSGIPLWKKVKELITREESKKMDS